MYYYSVGEFSDKGLTTSKWDNLPKNQLLEKRVGRSNHWIDIKKKHQIARIHYIF